MKTPSDQQYLRQLIAQGEHQQQDFKYKVTDAEKLARSVSAFANTDGGRLLIGVRDDGHISGIRSEEEIFMMHSAAYKYCEPQLSILFETMHAEGRNVVIATVPPSPKKPIFALTADGKRRAYIRINDENILASPVHLDIWRQESSRQGTLMHYSDDAQPDCEARPPAPPQGNQAAGPLRPVWHCRVDLPGRMFSLLACGMKSLKFLKFEGVRELQTILRSPVLPQKKENYCLKLLIILNS